ncbi:tetratricopeptide repeat protein [Ktedonobacter racemifer]|uniref:TPR repeat-containing protein n=1 Tax=Ktedonobacter racemifer DSM 44963 TaxID=485913 RepID=D6TTG2_KTERA|nr:tetratricopeptide repeat protein [Ktedonobacter racemifer]EFH83713.1 TPR repeat-containing protein [Ktedonobacter racemifer DSM 44963]
MRTGKSLCYSPCSSELTPTGKGDICGTKAHYYKDLCAQLAPRLDKQLGDFRAYQQAVSEVEKVRRESGKILEEVRREQDDLGSSLRGATIDIVASALSTYVPGSKGIVTNEKVKKGADALLQLTGEQVAYLYQRFHRRLGKRLEEYLDPARRLGFALGWDLARCAANYPILVFFDTYEEVDEGDQFLRLVMAAAGPRVGWIIAGRDNLWSGVGQRERSTTPEYGYKDLVPFEHGLSINFNSEDVGAFTSDNIREYFELLCQHFPCEPPLPMLAQDEITRVWDVTKGIPLAVNIAAALYSETIDINQVTEEVEGRKEIIDKMVYRYLQHTRIDERERGKLYALALLRRTDEPMILAQALGLTPEEAKTRYKETLSHLHRRYSFIFTEKGEPSLHREVRHFLRLFLLERRKEPEIQAINSSLKESIETALQELEQQRAYSTLKERLQDEDWTALYLDLCEHLYWLDPVEGLRHLLPFMIAAAIYNRRINSEAKQVGEFFISSLFIREQNNWTWATSSLVKLHNRKPSPEELHGLEELHKLYLQSPGRLPALLNSPEELEAALCWRLGEANLRQNADKAVEWYEQAFTVLSQEEELKEALAGSYYELGKKHREEKRYDDSIRFLSQAIDLKPRYTYAFMLRGLVYFDQKQYQIAFSDYDTAISLEQNSAIAYNNRGAIYDKLQQYNKAIDDYNVATRLDSTRAILYNNRGISYNSLQQYNKAIDDYNTAISLEPNYAPAYYNRAYSYLYINDVEKAKQDFITAVEKDLNDLKAKWMCVFVSLTEQYPGLEVAGHLDQLAAIKPQKYTSLVCLGVAFGLRGKLKKGLIQLDAVIHARSKSIDAFFWKGMLCAYYYRGKPHLAVEAIEQALANGLPPVLLRPLYWLREDNPAFFEQYARPLLERYGV